MKTLSDTWFADGYIDFELKRYRLLAYLQEIETVFSENKLYPPLSDIIFHYNNLLAFKRNKSSLEKQFPKRLSQVDLQRITLLYEKLINNNELMEELESIIYYGIKKLEQSINNGKQIYDYVEDQLEIIPIGIIPLIREEGYLFLMNGQERETRVYEYRMSIFERYQEKYRALKTTFIGSWMRNYSNTFEAIKSELIKKCKHIPNPAVFSAVTKNTFPFEETLLPIVKRSIVKLLADQAA